MIGWYVHHQGRGHLQRALTVAAQVDEPVLGLSRLARPSSWRGPWVVLPGDVPDGPPRDPTARGRLHWSPVGATTRCWATALSRALESHAVHRLVVDVSVEVAVLARLHGVQVVVVAQRGDREDPPHRLAYDLADDIVAPWPEAAGTDGWPGERRDRTSFVGALSRFDGRVRHVAADVRPHTVLVLLGRGGHDIGVQDVHAAARATPEWSWTTMGPFPPSDARASSDVTHLGWVDQPGPLVATTDVIVTHAGMNAVAEVAASHRPAIVLAMARPHDEQHHLAAALRRLDVAEVVDAWPSAEAWRPLLHRAAARSGADWQRWSDGRGARRFADVVLDRRTVSP